MQRATALVECMSRFFDKGRSSTSARNCRLIVDLILLCGRALYRVVTAWHHQVLDLREQGTESGKTASYSIQGYLGTPGRPHE
jgi:hypothetical protein